MDIRFILSVFILWPFLALLPATIFLFVYRRYKRPVILITALAWFAYFPYEQAIKMRLLCSGECNIRVDLLLLYPILALLSLLAIIAYVRKGRGTSDDPQRDSLQPAAQSNHRAPTTKPDSSNPKISTTLFALIFAIGFTAGGVAGGVVPLYKQLSGWWKASSFVPVSAVVVSVGLESRTGKSTSYRAVATFAYDYLGISHISNRVQLVDGGYDNIGSYHQDIHEQLSKARDSLAPVTLWVNPQQPDEAVYDRSIRWMLVVFLIPFAVLFSAVGLGAWWVIWRIWRNGDAPQDSLASLFKGGRAAVAPGALQAIQGDGGGVAGLTLMCVFWNTLSWPIAVLFYSSAKVAPWWVAALVSMFPAVGLVLLFNVLKIVRAQRRIGKPVLTLEGPVSPGMPLRGRIRFYPALGTQLASPEATHEVNVTAEYVRAGRRGEDINGIVLWQGPAMQMQLVRGTQHLDFAFDLPKETKLRPSYAGKWGPEYFQVVLKTLGGTVKFRLPESAASTVDLPVQQALPSEAADESPADATRIVTRVRWVARAVGFAFAAFFMWNAITQFAIPFYQSFSQKSQISPQSSTQNQLPPIHAPIRLDSWAGNGFGVVGRVTGNMTILDHEVQLFPESVELRSSGGCAPDCPVIRSVAFSLSRDGSDSFSILAQGKEIPVLKDLPNGSALPIGIPAEQLPFRLKFTDRSQLADLCLTLEINGAVKDAGKFSPASWYTHSERLASELAQEPVRLEPVAQGDQLRKRAQQAAREGRFSDLQQMLQAGADANALDAEGQTMLMRAADRGDLKSVELLLAHGAQVNAKTAVDKDGRGAHTALHDAMRLDAVDVVDALVRAGADTHAKANQVWTPMHYAAYLGAVKSIRYLHGRGVDINEPFAGARGSTPLMLAAQYNQVQAIHVLLELGAAPNRKDIYGEDACGYARYFKTVASSEALGCN